jgi:hypothetical protein
LLPTAIKVVNVQLSLQALLHCLGQDVIRVDLSFKAEPGESFAVAIPLKQEIDLEMERSLPILKDLRVGAEESVIGTNDFIEQLKGGSAPAAGD